MKNLLARLFTWAAVKCGAPDGYWHQQCQKVDKNLRIKSEERAELAEAKLHQMTECCYCMVRNLYRYGIERDTALNVSLDPFQETTNVELQKMWVRAIGEVNHFRDPARDSSLGHNLQQCPTESPLDKRLRLEKWLDK